jgi:hypothetical protein
MRAFEMCPETATFVSKSPASSVVAVISVVEDSSDLGLPSEGVFFEELQMLRRENSRLCEVSNQVVIPDFRGTGVNGELVRCAFAHAVFTGCTDIVCSVSSKLVPFYTVMGFETLSTVKSYSSIISDPVVFMRLGRIQTRYTTDSPSHERAFSFCKKFLYDENPYYAKMPLWMMLNNQMFLERLELSSLFGRCPDIAVSSSDIICSSLKRRLGSIYDISRQAAKRISAGSISPRIVSKKSSRLSFTPSKPIRVMIKRRNRPTLGIQFRSFDKRAVHSRHISLPIRLASIRHSRMSNSMSISATNVNKYNFNFQTEKRD